MLLIQLKKIKMVVHVVLPIKICFDLLSQLWSHFILGVLNYCVLTYTNKYKVLIVLQNNLAAMEVGCM